VKVGEALDDFGMLVRKVDSLAGTQPLWLIRRQGHAKHALPARSLSISDSNVGPVPLAILFVGCTLLEKAGGTGPTRLSKKSVPAVVEPSNLSPKARRFTDDFKRDSVRLVTDERYIFQATATAVGVSQKSLRDGMPSLLHHRCRAMVRADVLGPRRRSDEDGEDVPRHARHVRRRAQIEGWSRVVLVREVTGPQYFYGTEP